MSIVKFVRDDGKTLLLDYPWGIYGIEGLDYPDIAIESEPYAFEDGSYWTRNQAEKRVVTISAYYRDRDQFYVARDAVGQFFNHFSEYELYIEYEGKDCYIEGRCTSLELPLKKSNGHPRCVIEFTSVNPYLQSIDEFGRNLNEVSVMIRYPLPDQSVPRRHYLADEKKPYSVREFAATVDLENNGIAPTGFLATIKFEEGTDWVAIADITSGKTLRIDKSFTAGDVLTIDTKNKVARLNGQKFYKGITADSEFFELEIGTNAFSFDAHYGASTAEVDIYFRAQRLVY